LLDAAAANGWQEEEREDGPEIAFKPEHVGRFLDWIVKTNQPRVALLEPVKVAASSRDEAVIDVDPLANLKAPWLRPGDHIAVGKGGRTVDTTLWRINGVTEIDKTPAGGNRRWYLSFRCSRWGVIEDRNWLSTSKSP
jgi:hypothetical protein